MLDEESAGQEPAEDVVAPEATEAEVEEPEAPEGEEGEEEAPEEVEYDLGGGQRVKVPANATAKEVFEAAQKAFKDVEANWTRKNMDVAEKAKALEARQAAVEKLASLNDNVLDEYARGRAVQLEIEQLQKNDLNALWQTDPNRARMLSDRIAQKQADFQRIVQNVSRLEGELTQEQAREQARRLEEGRHEVERRIPEFAKHESDLVEYAVRNGIPKEQAGNWAANPIVTEMAWKAMQWDRAQEKAKQAAKPKPPQAQPVAPTRSTGGRPKLDLNRDADKMSADEWLKRRQAQLRA